MSGLGSDLGVGRAPGGYPTLDTDLYDGDGSAKKRICIATPEIAGVAGSGGIGTTYGHLARHLAQWGHDVVIAYVNDKASNTRLMEEAGALFARFGAAFEPIAPRRCDDSVREQVSAPTMALLDWLRARERPFDIVHVSEWRGLGYGPLLAKSLGMAFGSTHFVVKGSSPLLWLTEANRRFISSEYELGLVFLEKRSIELADTVICGSAYLLEWMRDAGYAVPVRSFVWPNLFPEPAPSPATAARFALRDGARLKEMVFFGRLEPRKGLLVFADAVDWLVRRGRAPRRTTFLGGPVGLIDGPGLIRDRSRTWPTTVKMLTDLGADEAVAYLSEPGRLAVIPSLIENSSIAVTECLHAGIPFVAAATGGTPELVAPEDHSRTLVAPDHIALGERIADLAGAPLRAARPRWNFERALEVWSRWHAQSVPFDAAVERFEQRARVARAETPLVTVCIVHHERPALVRMAVNSVLAQDYPAIEAVLIDDGSESTEAHAALDALKTEFAEHGWRVIRQENRYLGAARNAAAAAARGEWLLFLDDDNVLFPDAVSRLVRAARFSGADSITAASIRFSGEGDPRLDTKSHGAPIRFFGAALASNLFHNVVGDACALVRREAFETVGGFTEERGFAFSDMSFFSSLRQAGLRVEYMPEVTFYYRVLPDSMFRTADKQSAMHRHLVTKPYLERLPAEERAFASFAIGCIDQAPKQTKSPRQMGHVMTLARRASQFGVKWRDVIFRFDSDWVKRARDRYDLDPFVELRRNGRTVARVGAQNAIGGILRIPIGFDFLTGESTLYSLHDVVTGEALAALAAPAHRQARCVDGAVENQSQPIVRGWILDPGNPERKRRVAIHLNGGLRMVIVANRQRTDIARWKRTDGHHGFFWSVPDTLRTDDTRIDVLDADTGRPLRGSPLMMQSGQVVASRQVSIRATAARVSRLMGRRVSLLITTPLQASNALSNWLHRRQ